MKKIIIPLFLVITLCIIISSSNIGLIENQTWQSNLIGSTLSNGAVFGDIDNDGDLDVVSIGCTAGAHPCFINPSNADKSYVWINNGTSFVEGLAWEQNLSNTLPGSLALGDIDNDGDLDLVLSGTYTVIYTNNGTAFQENQTWQNYLTGEDGAASDSVAFGDIDNDGDLDLVFPDMSDDTPPTVEKTIWLNNGTTFINSTIWGAGIIEDNERISTGLIDLDNDNDLDLHIIGLDSANGYENNGTSLIANGNWNTFSRDEASVAWGDIDNDGDFDHMITGSTSTSFLINDINNTGEFTDGTSQWDYDLGGFRFGSTMFGDYDNNGYLDLILVGSTGAGQNINVAENNRTTFAQDVTAQENLTETSESSALWGDVDNDNDLDLVVIGSQKVYISNASLTNPNEAPIPPTNFSSSYSNREIRLGWLNGSDNETTVNGLYYNLKLGTVANNHSIISGIYGGSGDASRGGTAFGYFGNMMQRKNFTLSVDRLQPSTTYYWSVQTIDTALKAGNWSSVQSFTTSADLNKPNVTLNSPVDNANLSSFNVTFNASVADENITNVSLWVNWTGTFQINQTNSTGVDNAFYIFTKNLTGAGDGVYSWMIQATDNSTNIQNSSIRTFRIDKTSPTFTNLTNQTVTINTSFSYDINATDSGVGLGSFSVNNTANFTINSTTGVITNATPLSGFYTLNITVNDTLGNLNWSLFNVNVTSDTTKPNITINAPTAGQTLSSTNVTVNISFVDNVALSYCSYNVTNSTGGNVTNTTSITCGNNSVGYQTITDGSNYVLTAFSNDTSGNINITNRTFSVDVPDSGGGDTGGGGGGASTTPAVNQTISKFDIDFSISTTGTLEVKQGDIKTFSFNGEVKHSITILTLTQNSITLLITSEPIVIQVKLGEIKQIDINGDNVNDIEIKLLSITAGKASFSLSKLEGAEIFSQEELDQEIRKEALFDVKISLSNLFNIVKTGREVIAKIEVLNVNNIGQVDVVVDYYITTKEDNQTKLAEGSDTLAVEAIASFVRSLRVPYNLKSGNYLFNVNIKYKDKILASGNAEFRVIKSYEITIALGVIILIVIAIFSYLWILNRKEKMLERQIKVFEKSMGNKIIIIRKKKKGDRKWLK